ncbi:MAG: class I SAM-dependent methyltransferase [Candidatus Jacksonbacteria bacterium]|nr:class I SAM-dependent methyltransferase [Candidatus Jacksonbacteria bacterium]
METAKNIYERENQPTLDAEAERLKALEFPVFVSEQLLGDINGKTVLDIGAGTNTILQSWISEKGGKYIALDPVKQYAQEQRAEGVFSVVGKGEDLPFQNSSVDVAHTRFVLMHLDAERRAGVIQEARRVSKERALFLEYDWNTIVGGEKIKRFVDFCAKIAGPLGINLFMGSSLENDIRHVIGENGKFQIQHFLREKGDYYAELIPFAVSVQKVVAYKNTELLEEFNAIFADLQEEAHKSVEDGQEQFFPVDIVAVEVRR